MTRTKRNLIIIGSIVGFFVLLAVVFGALFSLRGIQVDYRSADLRNEYLYLEDDIIEDADIKMRKNILFIDVDESEERLEQKYPYARFEIVRNFPNKLVIYVYKREAVFKVENSQGNYEIYDRDLKCLEVVGNIGMTDKQKAIPVLKGFDVDLCGIAGNFMQNPTLLDKMGTIVDGVYAVGATNINGLMSNIVFGYDEENGFDTLVLQTKHGSIISIQDTTSNFYGKVADATKIYVVDIAQDPYYTSKLNEVRILVKKNYDKNNLTDIGANMIIVYPEKGSV